MEARTLAAAIALAFLTGLGAGWQLMPRQQPPAASTEAPLFTVTVTEAGATVLRTATVTIHVAAEAVTVTETVTALPVAAPRILAPTASLDCGEGGTVLRIHFVLANAGTGSVYANVSGISHGLLGVAEMERVSSPYSPPGLAEAGPQDAVIFLNFRVEDLEALSRLVVPPPEGLTLPGLRAGLEVPYVWEGGSGILTLDAVPLSVSEPCELPNK